MLLRCESLEPPMSQLGHSRRRRAMAGSRPCPETPKTGHSVGRDWVTKPSLTGSWLAMNTIGTVVVAALATAATCSPAVAILRLGGNQIGRHLQRFMYGHFPLTKARRRHVGECIGVAYVARQTSNVVERPSSTASSGSRCRKRPAHRPNSARRDYSEKKRAGHGSLRRWSRTVSPARPKANRFAPDCEMRPPEPIDQVRA